MSMDGRPVEILLVEDNPADVHLTQTAFRRGKVSNNMHVVQDGEQAMAFLRQDREYQNMPRPDLILLDLNLPRKDGREVLDEIKADPDLSIIPVIVLTTSASEEDILRSYRLHANGYITKPVDWKEFMEVVRTIEEFWLTVVRLPTEGTS